MRFSKNIACFIHSERYVENFFEEFFERTLLCKARAWSLATCVTSDRFGWFYTFHGSSCPNYNVGQTGRDIYAATFAISGGPQEDVAVGEFVQGRSFTEYTLSAAMWSGSYYIWKKWGQGRRNVGRAGVVEKSWEQWKLIKNKDKSLPTMLAAAHQQCWPQK